MSTIWPGSVVRISTAFTVDDVYTDPATVSLIVTAPDGTQTTYAYADTEIEKDGTGLYHRDETAGDPGLWRWRWVGTGAAAGPDEGSFYVETSLADRPGHCSLDDLKTRLRVTHDNFDDLLMRLIAAASEAVDDYCGRKLVADDAVSDRYYLLAPFAREREVLIDDLSAAPTQAAIVDEDGTESATLTVGTDLVMLPRNRESYRPITAVRLRVSAGWGYELRLRGVWGFPAVPEAIREATIETAADWHKNGQAVTTQSPDQFDPGEPPQRRMPLKARDLCRPFRRLGIA